MKRKSKFAKGEEVIMPFSIMKIDRRMKPVRYWLQSVLGGWALDESVAENELVKLGRHGARMILIFFALLFVPIIPAHADEITLWTGGVQPGQTYSLDLCESHCFDYSFLTVNAQGVIADNGVGVGDILASLGPILDTGVPQANFYSVATDPAAAMIAAYLIDPNPDPLELIDTLPSGNLYDGHFNDYPIQGDSVVTGLLIESTGDMVSYSVTGTNLVPEPGTMLLTLMGIVGVLAFGFCSVGRFDEDMDRLKDWVLDKVLA
jgi:hypothetical protein